MKYLSSRRETTGEAANAGPKMYKLHFKGASYGLPTLRTKGAVSIAPSGEWARSEETQKKQSPDGLVLKHASYEMKNNEKVVLAAVQQGVCFMILETLHGTAASNTCLRFALPPRHLRFGG